MPRIGLLTCEQLPLLTDDDHSLVRILEGRGWECLPIVWSHPHEEWRSCDVLLLRSTWDYFLRFAEFSEWLKRVEASRVPLIHSPSLVRWNWDKKYLRELERAGARLPATEWLDVKSGADLNSLIVGHGWQEAVLKPTVSANANATLRLRSKQEALLAQEVFARDNAHTAFLLQEFHPQVLSPGEVSLIFFGGQFSHSVLKTPALGDFRVQTDHGGSVRAYEPSESLIAQAQSILSAVPCPWTYARVDGVIDPKADSSRSFVLMEVELIEPSLYFAQSEGAAERLAKFIVNGHSQAHKPAP